MVALQGSISILISHQMFWCALLKMESSIASDFLILFRTRSNFISRMKRRIVVFTCFQIGTDYYGIINNEVSVKSILAVFEFYCDPFSFDIFSQIKFSTVPFKRFAVNMRCCICQTTINCVKLSLLALLLICLRCNGVYLKEMLDSMHTCRRVLRVSEATKLS